MIKEKTNNERIIGAAALIILAVASIFGPYYLGKIILNLLDPPNGIPSIITWIAGVVGLVGLLLVVIFIYAIIKGLFPYIKLENLDKLGRKVLGGIECTKSRLKKKSKKSSKSTAKSQKQSKKESVILLD